MKKLILPILILILFFVFPHPVSADFQKAYADYVYNQNLYRQSYNDFQTAKSTFLTYDTLASQNEALSKFRKVLQDRNQVMVVYYDLINERLITAEGVPEDYKNTFSTIRLSEQKWLAENQKKIEAVSSIDDLNSVSSEFESRYQQMESETKQAFGRIIIGKELILRQKLDGLSVRLNDKLTEIAQSGENVTTYKRNLTTAKNKLELFDEKMRQVNQTLIRPIGEIPNVFEGQQKLTEANFYLRDTLNSMQEIINLITR